MPKTKKSPETNPNGIASIKIVTKDGSEYEFPAFHRTAITEYRGVMQANNGMFASLAPNGKNLLVVYSSTDDEVMSEIEDFLKKNVERIINN
jgi:hypothetical protein